MKYLKIIQQAATLYVKFLYDLMALEPFMHALFFKAPQFGSAASVQTAQMRKAEKKGIDRCICGLAVELKSRRFIQLVIAAGQRYLTRRVVAHDTDRIEEFVAIPGANNWA